MNILQNNLFKRVFPLDVVKIRQLTEDDKKKLVYTFRRAERELCAMGGHLGVKGLMFEGFDLLLFSALPYIEIIKQINKTVNENDIDVMNMMLYMEQHKFPLNLFFNPLIPRKYCVGDRKRK